MTLNNAFNKVVFLIGAGASVEAGCLMSAEMLNSLFEEINNLLISDEYYRYKDDFREIYNFILASLNYQAILQDPKCRNNYQCNIEDFVMILRQLIDKEFIIPSPLVGNWNEKILKWQIKYSDVDIFEQFKHYITFLLVNHWTKFDPNKADGIIQPIRDIVSKSEQIKINIFSLNYDLIFEDKLNTSHEKLLDNGFSEKEIANVKRKCWVEDFNDDNSPAKINLYKLHGSLDWEYDEDIEDIIIKENVYDNQEPLIIFGSYSKMLSFDPFLYMLSKFRDLLHEATILFVIGYSFHDKYINNMIIQQLSINTIDSYSKKLIIIDPYNSQTQAQFSDKLKLIQRNKSINDIINFSQLSPDRIKILKITANEFFKNYFSNDAKLIKDELSEIESDFRVF